MSFNPVVLDEREQSSMASTWDELLVLKQDEQGQFYLSICMHEVLGSIYDLPEEDQYDDNGETVVPSEFNGREVVGLGDGEWLLGASLEEAHASSTFKPGSLCIADAFLAEHGWQDKRDGGSIREAIETAMRRV